MGRRVLALDLARQLGQPVQQLRLLVRAGHPDRAGQFGQLALGGGQRRRGLARSRKAQQRRHAVGVDLQQALHQPAQPARRKNGLGVRRRAAGPGVHGRAHSVRVHPAGQQHHAREAVGVQGEVGVDLAQAVGHLRCDQAVLMEQLRIRRALSGRGAGNTHKCRPARHWPGNAASHSCGTDSIAVAGSRSPNPRRVDGARETPGHEFGVQFPAQAEGAQVHPQVGGLRIGLRQVMVAQQRGQVLAAGLALGGVAQHHDVRDRQRRAHGLGRPGVDLVVQRHALRMASWSTACFPLEFAL